MKKSDLLKDINLSYLLDIDIERALDDSETFDDFEENILELIHQEEVIYYANAIKFLSEEDQSLRESLEIAEEYGYTAGNLNSELLATLLTQRRMKDEFSEFRDEFEAIFE